MQREGSGWTDGVIGVVGEDAPDVADRIAAADERATVVTGSAATGADLVVAVGESALLATVRSDATTPVLPVGTGGAVRDVPAADLEAAIESVRSGTARLHDRPLLAAAVGEEEYRALMDVMAVTTEPAKISEFAIDTGATTDGTAVDVVRADGVVVATPAGTPGYASAAGGPVLTPDLSAVAVVPVGPFRIDRTHWVLDVPTTVTVARDETPVSLLVDDEEVGSVPPHEPIELTWGSSVPLVRTPVSRSPFEGD
ncbi:MAG: hypothetical protein ABEJ76_02620 [Halanaeroarchaeum sp.]